MSNNNIFPAKKKKRICGIHFSFYITLRIFSCMYCSMRDIYFHPSDLNFLDHKIRSIFPMALHLCERYKTTICELNAQHVLYAH